MKLIALGLVLLCGGLLVAATGDFPAFGDPNSPAALHVSPHYITKSLQETSVPNFVTTVLADYRGYDTMFETSVIFAAGVACFFLLRSLGPTAPRVRVFRHQPTGVVIEVRKELSKTPDAEVFAEIDALWTPHDFIVKIVARMLAPFIQLFGLYVIAHGHHSPGGGFQGGVILGASVILMAICYDLRYIRKRLREGMAAIMSAAGVFIYAGVGAWCLFFLGNFLDYSALAGVLGVSPIMARSLGILFVEVGVGLSVMATMILIYNNLASAGRWEEGL